MANIIKAKTELIKQSDTKKIDLLKPLVNQIKLFDSFIGKVYLLKDVNPLLKVKIGDKLSLKRRTSTYSKYEVLIYNSSNELVGYVPENDEIVLSRLMDAGKSFFCIAKKIDHVRKYPVISIEIYMEDF